MEISPLLHPARSEKVKSWSCWSPVGSEIESSENCDDDEFCKNIFKNIEKNISKNIHYGVSKIGLHK